MSTEAQPSMRYAWRRLVVRDAHLTESTRRVLLELESYANPDGTNAHPGVELIASELRTTTKPGTVNEKTVRRALRTGVERGYIECTRKGGGGQGKRNNADTYRLTLPFENERVDHRAVAEDADQLDTSDPEQGMNGPHTEQTAGTVDIQMSGVRSETVDTQMSTDQTETANIQHPNGGHPDVHVPDLLHQIIYREGVREVTSSLAEPADSLTPSKSISIQEPSSAADVTSTGRDEPSRFCDRHPNDTTKSCWRCGKARERHEQWEAEKKQAEKARHIQEAQERTKARNAARVACTLCEGKSEADKDRCFHQPDSVEAWKRNRFQMNAVRSEVQRKQGDRANVGGKPALPTGARSVRRPGLPRLRSGSDAERAAAHEELRRRPPVPVPTGLPPADGREETRPQNAPAA